MNISITIIILFLFQSISFSQEIEILYIGEMGNEKLVEKLHDSGEPSGYTNLLSEIKEINSSKRLTLKKDLAFGTSFKISGEKDRYLISYRWSCPGIQNPTLDTLSTSWIVPYSATTGKKKIVGYKLSENWEMVAGEWKLEIIVEEKTLANLTFEILPQPSKKD